MIRAGCTVAVDTCKASAEAVAVELETTGLLAVARDSPAWLRLSLLGSLNESARRN